MVKVDTQGTRRLTSRDGRSLMLTRCSAAGCRALTLGGTCIKHDPLDAPSYPRGRPFARAETGQALGPIAL
jgi:hypothetical protein